MPNLNGRVDRLGRYFNPPESARLPFDPHQYLWDWFRAVVWQTLAEAGYSGLVEQLRWHLRPRDEPGELTYPWGSEVTVKEEESRRFVLQGPIWWTCRCYDTEHGTAAVPLLEETLQREYERLKREVAENIRQHGYQSEF